MKKVILWLIIGLVALFVLIRLVPYGRNHTNPPVVQEPQWDSPQTRELAKRACFDGHSNETIWPWEKAPLTQHNSLSLAKLRTAASCYPLPDEAVMITRYWV